MYFTTMDSPIGTYLIGASERGITYVDRFKGRCHTGNE